MVVLVVVDVCLSISPPTRPASPPLSPSPSTPSFGVFFARFDFLRGSFFFSSSVGVTPLNGTMQPSVKLKLLVSLELLKRGFCTCMHSYTLPYAMYIAN